MVIQTIERGSSGYHEATQQLGAGLGAIAGGLISAKLNQKAKQQQEHDLTQAYIKSGVPPAQAHAMARADEKTRSAFYQQHLTRGGLANAPEEPVTAQGYGATTQQPNTLANLAALRVAQETPQFQQQQQYQNVLSALGGKQAAQGPEAAQAGLQNLQTAGALSLLQGPKKQQELSEQGLKNLLKAGQAQQLPQQAIPVIQQQPVEPKPKVPTPEEQLIDSAQRKKLINNALNNGDVSAWKKLMSAPKELTPAQKLAAAKEERMARQAEDKETKAYFDKVSAFNEAAKETDTTLKRMEKLINEGGLPISSLYKGLKTLEEEVSPGHAATAGAAAGGVLAGIPGGAIGAVAGALISPIASMLRHAQKLTSPNTEEFEKLSASFVRQAKDVFGTRLTDADLNAFMQMIPTLAHTDEGKKAIIRNMKAFNEAAKVKYRTMREIIKENGGHRPLDLSNQVEDRAEPKLNQISKKFESGENI